MADIGASNWNEADASNNTAAPDGAPEGMAPSGVNDTMRAMMGATKRWYDWSVPLATGGTSTAYTLSYAVAPTLVDGMTHLVQFNAINGANPTLNVNALGAKPVTFNCGGAWSDGLTNTMPANMLGVNQVVRVVYNAAAGTYRCLDLPLVLRQTVSGASTLDFQNIPTNVNNLQLLAQIIPSVNNTSLALQTFTSAGAISNGGSDYTYGYINWASSASAVTQATAASILLAGTISNTFPVMLDAVTGAIQSANPVLFNWGTTFIAASNLNGIRGGGYRVASAIISGVRLLPGSGTLTGTATLLLS